jgi:hypothetical protein
MMENMYNFKIRKKINFFEKTNYLFLLMWKLTLGYGNNLSGCG